MSDPFKDFETGGGDAFGAFDKTPERESFQQEDLGKDPEAALERARDYKPIGGVPGVDLAKLPQQAAGAASIAWRLPRAGLVGLSRVYGGEATGESLEQAVTAAAPRVEAARKPDYVPQSGEKPAAVVGEVAGATAALGVSGASEATAGAAKALTANKYGQAALEGAGILGAFRTIDDMAAKGEVDGRDVAISAGFGALLGTAGQAGADVVHMAFQSAAGKAASRLMDAATQRIEMELQSARFRFKRGLGIPQETGLVPVDVKQAYADGRLSLADAAAASQEVFDEAVRIRGGGIHPDVVNKARAVVADEAYELLVQSGLPPELARVRVQKGLDEVVASHPPQVPGAVQATAETGIATPPEQGLAGDLPGTGGRSVPAGTVPAKADQVAPENVLEGFRPDQAQELPLGSPSAPGPVSGAPEALPAGDPKQAVVQIFESLLKAPNIHPDVAATIKGALASGKPEDLLAAGNDVMDVAQKAGTPGGQLLGHSLDRLQQALEAAPKEPHLQTVDEYVGSAKAAAAAAGKPFNEFEAVNAHAQELFAAEGAGKQIPQEVIDSHEAHAKADMAKQEAAQLKQAGYRQTPVSTQLRARGSKLDKKAFEAAGLLGEFQDARFIWRNEGGLTPDAAARHFRDLGLIPDENVHQIAEAWKHEQATKTPLYGQGGGERALEGSSSYASKGIFREGTPQELGGFDQIKPLEMPEMVRLARELMGQVPEISRRMGPETRGLFKPIGDGFIRIRPELFENTEQAAKTLAHELGHLTDYLPDKTMKRGNILGRLLTLRKFMQNTHGEIDISNRDMRKELVELSEFWRPYPRDQASPGFIKYRESAKELYADAISALFNSPGTLEKMAPNFYRSFFDHLDKKPEVKREFLELQELLAGKSEDVVAARRADTRRMFARAEDIFKANREAAALAKQSTYDAIRQRLDDKYWPIIRKVDEVEARGGLDAGVRDPRHVLQEGTYVDAPVRVFFEDLDRAVTRPLASAGVSIDDIGEYMKLKRVMTERATMANPGGQTAETAKLEMDALAEQLGPEKFQLLENLVKKAHDEHFLKAWQLAEKAQLWSKGTLEGIVEPNQGNYGTFVVLDYLIKQPFVTAMLKGQQGTFKDVANVYLGTILKSVAAIRASYFNMAKLSVRDLLQRHFADEIAPTRAIRSGDGPALFRVETGKGGLELMENGKLTSYDVDPYIAESFARNRPGEASLTAAILNPIFNGVFRPLWITYNPGFLYYNLQRDFWRNYKLIPGATVGNLLKAYFKALPAAFRRTAGMPDALVHDLEENAALNLFIDDFNVDPREDEYGMLLRRYGMTADPSTPTQRLRRTLLKPFAILLKGMEFAQALGESLGKLGGATLRKDLGESGDTFYHNVRNFTATPNFRVRGTRTETTNALFNFSNIMKEGFKSDAQIATDPKTRGGYWWKTAKVDLTPKLFMFLAASGYLGKELKDHYNRMTEYDKTNYITVPVGSVKGGQWGWKSVYARFGHDESGRLAAAVFWKMLNALGPGSKQLQQILAVGAGQLPNLNPVVTIPMTWGMYLLGKNPYDYYRGRLLLPEAVMKKGGWPATKLMIQWTVNQAGMTSFATYDSSRKTWKETLLQSTPLLNRMIKVSDYGKKEEIHKMQDAAAAGAK